MRSTPVIDFMQSPLAWVLGAGLIIVYVVSGGPMPGLHDLGEDLGEIPTPLRRRARPQWNPTPFRQPRPPGVPQF